MRKLLINLLGGYTEKEYIEANRHSYNEGASEALLTLKLKADILYGIPADEWSKQIYDGIVELKKQYDDESDENQNECYEAMVEAIKSEIGSSGIDYATYACTSVDTNDGFIELVIDPS